MSIETNLFNSGGGIVVAGLIYAGVSMYGTGPVVLERMVHKSGWIERCERSVKSDLQTNRSPPAPTPQIGCDDVFGLMGPDMGRLVKSMGGAAACQVLDAKNAANRQLEQWKEKRLAAATSRARSRCDCAVSYVGETKRGSVGLFAGSARLIRPTVIRNLDGALQSALNTPECVAITKSGGAS